MACNNCNNCGNDININIATNRYGYNNGYFFDYYGANLCNQCCSTNTCSDCNTECSTPEILECPYGMQNTSCSVYNGTEYETPVITTGMDLNTVLENIVDLLVSTVPAFECSDLEDCSIDSLQDVDTTTVAPEVGDVLQWDGTNWVPATVSSLLVKKYTVAASGGDITIANFITAINGAGATLIAAPGTGKLLQIISIKKYQDKDVGGSKTCVYRIGANTTSIGTGSFEQDGTDNYKNQTLLEDSVTASGIHSLANTALTVDNSGTFSSTGSMQSIIFYITYNIITL
jgi:hypothetical protein